MTVFYGPEQAGIHHERFGRLAGRAADLLLRELASAGLATGAEFNQHVGSRADGTAIGGLEWRAVDAVVTGGPCLFDASIHGRSGPNGLRVQFHDAPDWSVGVRETEDATTVTREIATFRR